jgi:hypothetical protein
VDASLGLPILVGLIAVALLFDFLNGLHDAANSIATIVSTRVLRPHYAVFWAASFNFIAFMVFGLHVANTIGTGIIEPSVIDASVIFAALTGAIVWNLVTWGLGIPSSSSHALIGGLLGAGLAKAGFSAAVWGGLTKALLAIVLSPLVGFLIRRRGLFASGAYPRRDRVDVDTQRRRGGFHPRQAVLIRSHPSDERGPAAVLPAGVVCRTFTLFPGFFFNRTPAFISVLQHTPVG